MAQKNLGRQVAASRLRLFTTPLALRTDGKYESFARLFSPRPSTQEQADYSSAARRVRCRRRACDEQKSANRIDDSGGQTGCFSVVQIPCKNGTEHADRSSACSRARRHQPARDFGLPGLAYYPSPIPQRQGQQVRGRGSAMPQDSRIRAVPRVCRVFRAFGTSTGGKAARGQVLLAVSRSRSAGPSRPASRARQNDFGSKRRVGQSAASRRAKPNLQSRLRGHVAIRIAIGSQYRSGCSLASSNRSVGDIWPQDARSSGLRQTIRTTLVSRIVARRDTSNRISRSQPVGLVLGGNAKNTSTNRAAANTSCGRTPACNSSADVDRRGAGIRLAALQPNVLSPMVPHRRGSQIPGQNGSYQRRGYPSSNQTFAQNGCDLARSLRSGPGIGYTGACLRKKHHQQILSQPRTAVGSRYKLTSNARIVAMDSRSFQFAPEAFIQLIHRCAPQALRLIARLVCATIRPHLLRLASEWGFFFSRPDSATLNLESGRRRLPAWAFKAVAFSYWACSWNSEVRHVGSVQQKNISAPKVRMIDVDSSSGTVHPGAGMSSADNHCVFPSRYPTESAVGSGFDARPARLNRGAVATCDRVAFCVDAGISMFVAARSLFLVLDGFVFGGDHDTQ